MASSLLGVLAQRLVRNICPDCRREVPNVLASASVPTSTSNGSRVPEAIAGGVQYEGAGCENCSHTGFRGRSGIYELLPVEDEVRNLILKRASADVVREKAIECGMRILRDDGWLKVSSGTTTVSEIIRVTRD